MLRHKEGVPQGTQSGAVWHLGRNWGFVSEPFLSEKNILSGGAENRLYSQLMVVLCVFQWRESCLREACAIMSAASL